MRLSLALAAAAALTLAACSDADVASVQAKTLAGCKYVPTVSTVTNIVAAAAAQSFLPVLGAAEKIAGAICDAVTTNPLADGPGPKNYKPTVLGIAIKGKFVS